MLLAFPISVFLWAASCLLVAAAEPRQIDPVVVLLPWTDPGLASHAVNFTLKGYGGCYKWLSQRTDLLELLPPSLVDRAQVAESYETTTSPVSANGPYYDSQRNCGHFAVVRISSAALRRHDKDYVFAHDLDTADELRCEVCICWRTNNRTDKS